MVYIGPLSLGSGLAGLTYLMLPVIISKSPPIYRETVFMNHMYNNDPAFNRRLFRGCIRDLRLNSTSASAAKELAVWHVLAASAAERLCPNRQADPAPGDFFADRRPIVLFLHGSSGNRASRVRILLYRRLAHQLDYHVLAPDYRGYAESSGLNWPTAKRVHDDARAVYDWLLAQPHVSRARVTVLGHSLGGAIGVRLLANLPVEAEPSRLILVGTFDTMHNAMRTHPVGRLFKTYFPFFEHAAMTLANNSYINFAPAQEIFAVQSTPVLVIQSELDQVLPLELGRGLFEAAREAQQRNCAICQPAARFIVIEAARKCLHEGYWHQNKTIDAIRDFVEPLVWPWAAH